MSNVLREGYHQDFQNTIRNPILNEKKAREFLEHNYDTIKTFPETVLIKSGSKNEYHLALIDKHQPLIHYLVKVEHRLHVSLGRVAMIKVAFRPSGPIKGFSNWLLFDHLLNGECDTVVSNDNHSEITERFWFRQFETAKDLKFRFAFTNYGVNQFDFFNLDQHNRIQSWVICFCGWDNSSIFRYLISTP